MTREEIKEVHRVYEQIIVPRYLDNETIFKTYYLINRIHCKNPMICKRSITSFVMNHPIPPEEVIEFDQKKIIIITENDKPKDIKEDMIILTGTTEEFKGDKRTKEYKEYKQNKIKQYKQNK